MKVLFLLIMLSAGLYYFYTRVPVRRVVGDLKHNDNDDHYNNNYWFPVESARRKVPKTTIHVKYKKTNNEISERDFDIESFSRGEKGYLVHGFCHRKKRRISLSSLGFVEAVIISTGEMIDNIQDYLDKLYRETPDAVMDDLFNVHGIGIYCLVYLAATSGAIVKKERDIIIEWINSLPGYENMNQSLIEQMIAENYRPSGVEIRDWVQKSVEKEYDFTLVMPAIQKLKESQRDIGPEFAGFTSFLFQKTGVNR